MKRFCVLMVLTCVLTTAAAVNAQSLSPASVQKVIEVGQAPNLPPANAYFPSSPTYPPPKELAVADGAIQQSAGHTCENASNQTWFTQAAQHGAAALQRLRAICASGHSACCEGAKPGVCKVGECCEVGVAGCAKGFQVQVQSTRTGSLMLGAGVNSNSGVVGHIVLTGQAVGAPPCCGLKDLLQLTCPLGYGVSKTTAPCCCAKACACCEMCKAKAATTSNLPPMPGLPMQMRTAPLVTWTAPVPPVFHGVYPTPPGARIVVGLPASYQANRPAHLVTPDLEVHCETMTHRGDTILLEGNVLLLSKKHAQPVRIEAQRILVNMKDGSFTVDSSIRSSAPVTFGVLRMSGVEMRLPLVDAVVPAPTQRIIQVLPVPPMPR